MILRWGVLLLAVGACEALTPLPQDQGPQYVTVSTSSPAPTGGASQGNSHVGAGSNASPATSYAPYSGGGAVCPEWCALARGYHCEQGECILNGNTGPLQITLNWTSTPRARDDLDLHVVDPLGCEMYYSNRDCGAGSLDLDQNAACAHTDNVGGVGNDTENVIYEANTNPPQGQYSVWVVDWKDGCDRGGPDPIPYTVTIRYHGQTHTFQGTFALGSSAGGGTVASLTPYRGAVLINRFMY